VVRTTEVVWNQSSGALRLSAKWCDEIQSFDGIMSSGSNAGTLTTRRGGTESSAKLSLKKDEAEEFTRPRAAWTSLIERVLASRAPKCQ
jgi:hypothetical protein